MPHIARLPPAPPSEITPPKLEEPVALTVSTPEPSVMLP